MFFFETTSLDIGNLMQTLRLNNALQEIRMTR